MSAKFNYHEIRNYVRIGIAAVILGILGKEMFGLTDGLGNALILCGFFIFVIGIVKGAVTNSRSE